MSGFETSYRNRTCGELRGKDVGDQVRVCGWVGRRRDHGGLVFVDLRDRYGFTQIVFDPSLEAENGGKARGIRLEYVIQAEGQVSRRPEGMVNPTLPTGEIEVRVSRLRILSAAQPTPFQIEGPIEASEDLRLRYRYLDLRRPDLQNNLLLKGRLMKIVRDYLCPLGFAEVETPMLTRRTPEGARDYVVPSRLHVGKFYALPQSPQLYKQLLMIAGMDRYFQVARCFRDEDLRADRQPEFTQIDIEMSFVAEADIMTMTEGLFRDLFSILPEVDVRPPFPRVTYATAMERYGTDRPDMRFGLEITDYTPCFEGTGFEVFRRVLESRGRIRGLVVPGKAGYSRKVLSELEGEVRKGGARGLLWIRRKDPGWASSAGQHLTDREIQAVLGTGEVGAEDLVLLVAGPDAATSLSLDILRRAIGKGVGLARPDDFRFLWVVDPPLFEISPEDGELTSVHHPFTSPHATRAGTMEEDSLSVPARAYDIVLNGVELGGGSIRIHDRPLQERVLRLLGMKEDEYLEKFGFLLEALDFGAPPHGGIALGMDRIAMMIAGAGSLREVIAFPKTTAAQGLMEGSPSEIGDRDLEELHIKKLDIPRDSS